MKASVCIAVALGLVGSLSLSACGSPSGVPSPTPSAAYGPSNSGGSTTPAGSGSTAKPQPSTAAVTDACALVTEKEVSAALGVDPGPGTNVPRDGLSECQFGDAPKFVMVDLGTGDAKANYDLKRATPVAGAKFVDLDGVGDEAFGAFMSAAAVIGFYRGDSFVSITIYDDGSQDSAVTLAKAAAGRL